MRSSISLALLPLAAAHPWAKRDVPARLVVPEIASAADLIADQYIVKFTDDEASVAAVDDALSALSVEPEHVFSSVLNGFSATLDAETLEALRGHPQVDYVEQVVRYGTTAFVTQEDSTWGLARISHRARGSTSYTYDDSAGVDTCVYVLDTGVEVTHPEFEGRATFAANFIGGADTDNQGHGTHVAGTIASKTYGVAKKARVYSVKVLGDDGYGTTASLLAGMDFVPQDAAGRSCRNGVLANMSLSFNGVVPSVEQAVDRLVLEGDVFLGVAAGNADTDVYWVSPAGNVNACTVAALNSTSDARTEWSNFGGKVNVIAPGLGVLSTWINGGTNTISGTSMASPHVVGLAAYLAALEGFPGGLALCNRIAELSTKDIVTNLPVESIPSLNTPNRLAFNGNPSG